MLLINIASFAFIGTLTSHTMRKIVAFGGVFGTKPRVLAGLSGMGLFFLVFRLLFCDFALF
jgi:hypothetical protein